MKYFMEENILLHLGVFGKININKFHNSLSKIINNNDLRIKMSKKALKIFDGKGTERVYNEIINIK